VVGLLLMAISSAQVAHDFILNPGLENIVCFTFCLKPACKFSGVEVICRCTLAEKSDHYNFAGNCETEQACQKLWSAAALPDLPGGHSALWEFEADIPKLQYCP